MHIFNTFVFDKLDFFSSFLYKLKFGRLSSVFKFHKSKCAVFFKIEIVDGTQTQGELSSWSPTFSGYSDKPEIISYLGGTFFSLAKILPYWCL
jgi:hypothetical protein